MSKVTRNPPAASADGVLIIRRPRLAVPEGVAIVAAMLGVTTLGMILAGWIPVQFSIVTVFLFAGPHDWFEARYILGRLPHAGKLLRFFAFSFAGVIGLTAAFAIIPPYLRLHPEAIEHSTAYAIWNSAFILWCATLVQMRGNTNPRFDAGWVWLGLAPRLSVDRRQLADALRFQHGHDLFASMHGAGDPRPRTQEKPTTLAQRLSCLVVGAAGLRWHALVSAARCPELAGQR